MTYVQELRAAASTVRREHSRYADQLATWLEFETPYCQDLTKEPYPGTHHGCALAVARAINKEARRG